MAGFSGSRGCPRLSLPGSREHCFTSAPLLPQAGRTQSSGPCDSGCRKEKNRGVWGSPEGMVSPRGTTEERPEAACPSPGTGRQPLLWALRLTQSIPPLPTRGCTAWLGLMNEPLEAQRGRTLPQGRTAQGPEANGALPLSLPTPTPSFRLCLLKTLEVQSPGGRLMRELYWA